MDIRTLAEAVNEIISYLMIGSWIVPDAKFHIYSDNILVSIFFSWSRLQYRSRVHVASPS
jgi:hypothetical protein